MSAQVWTGRLFFGSERLLYAGPVLPTDQHAHHAHQIVISPDASIAMEGREGGSVDGRAFFVPANTLHAIVSPSARCVMLFVDPEGRQGRALTRVAPSSGSASLWRDAASAIATGAWSAPPDWPSSEALAARILGELVGEHVSPVVQHPAVKRAVRLIPSLLQEGDLRLAAVAGAVGISSSRLAHLFSAEVGIPMRPYVLWLRLMRAARAAAAGSTATDAAHAAGFSDGAHLARVCRRMFGISPSQMAVVEWVPPPPSAAGPDDRPT